MVTYTKANTKDGTPSQTSVSTKNPKSKIAKIHLEQPKKSLKKQDQPSNGHPKKTIVSDYQTSKIS